MRNKVYLPHRLKNLLRKLNEKNHIPYFLDKTPPGSISNLDLVDPISDKYVSGLYSCSLLYLRGLFSTRDPDLRFFVFFFWGGGGGGAG